MTARQTAAQQAVKEAATAAKRATAGEAKKSKYQKSCAQAVLPHATSSAQLRLYYRTVATSLGPFSLYVDEEGAVRCCQWQRCSSSEDGAALREEQRGVCASLQSRWYKNTSVEMVQPSPSSPVPGNKAAALLDQYFNPISADAGKPEALERVLLQVPVVYPPTTVFMTTTWSVLRQTVPSGETISYKGLGIRVSDVLSGTSAFASAASHAAPRAIGVAMGSNPIPVIVPCHRVLSSTGSLRGYGLGLRYKVWLLRHEQANVPNEKLRVVESEDAISTAVSLR
jgi:O-6-methylguanine DNA methyltransferase